MRARGWVNMKGKRTKLLYCRCCEINDDALIRLAKKRLLDCEFLNEAE
jgi:hypothetical protein